MSYLWAVRTTELNKMEQKAKKYDIRLLRKRLGLKQSEAAGMFGISTRSWQRLEANPVTLVEYVALIEASGGKFIFPENPYAVFERGGNTYIIKEFEV